MKKFFLTLALLASCAYSVAAENQNGDSKKIVVFARNDSGKSALDSKMKVLEFEIAAHLGNMGYSVIDYDLVLRNLNDYLGNPNAKYKSLAQKLKDELEGKTSAGAKIFENSSGTNLSAIIGADCILAVSCTGFGMEEKKFEGYGISTDNAVYKLKCAYSLSGARDAAGVDGGVEEATFSVKNTPDISISSDFIPEELVGKAAEKIANSIKRKNSDVPALKEVPVGEVLFSYKVEGLEFPEITVENGKYVLGKSVFDTSISSVNVEIDGIAHTAGEKIPLPRGIHTVKIEQSGIEPVERTIFATGKGDQKIEFSLRLSEKARLELKENMAFLEKMKAEARASSDKRILTEAEAEMIRGIATTFRQSGFKVDAKNLPNIQKTQSIFGQ